MPCIAQPGKKPSFGDATTGFPAKCCLRNERRNSILMTCHFPDLGSTSVVPRGKFDSTNQKHYPDLVSDTPSVCYFCTRFSDVFWRGNQCWRRQMSAVFLSYAFLCLKRCIAPCKGIQGGLGFCIPRREFRILSTGFQSLSVELGFWIPNPYFVFRFPEPRIPDTKNKIFSDSN